MADMYRNATHIIQVKNFNYIPKVNSLVLYNTNVLTIDKMRKILGIFRESQEQKTTSETSAENEIENEKNENFETSTHPKDYITDNDLLSNPFFTTLTPID